MKSLVNFQFIKYIENITFIFASFFIDVNKLQGPFTPSESKHFNWWLSFFLLFFSISPLWIHGGRSTFASNNTWAQQGGLQQSVYLFTARKQSLRRLCFHRCLSVHGGGVSAPLHAGYTNPWQTPGQTPLRQTGWDTVNKRAVRIPLECILVVIWTFAALLFCYVSIGFWNQGGSFVIYTYLIAFELSISLGILIHPPAAHCLKPNLSFTDYAFY